MILQDSTMHSFIKTLVLYILVCTTTSLGAVDSPEGKSVRWAQVVPDPQKIPNHNRFKLFHDILVEDDRHSLVLLRWKDVTEYHPTKCNLTQETHTFDNQVIRKYCDIYPPPNDDSSWIFAEEVTYLSRDRVLLTWREQHKTKGLRMTSHVINMDSCESSEYTSIDTYISLSLSIYMIVRHERSFDIIFSNAKVCSISYYCKLTFNHDGKQVSRVAEPLSAPYQPESETLTIIHAYAMNHNSRGGIVLVGNKARGLEVPEVYSPLLGWTSAQGLFYKNHWYSNSSGFATICWQLYKSTEFRCKWLDGTHANQVLTLRMSKQYVRISQIHNTPDGQILLLMPGYDDGTKIFVDEGQKDGRCKRLVEISHSDGLLKRIEMSIVEQNRFCFSFITKHILNGSSKEYPINESYKFTTKCIRVPRDGTHKFITCGQGYL